MPAAANPDVVLIHQLYHVGQHGDADNSFAPNWSPSGLPSYHDADGSHAMTTARSTSSIEGFVAGGGRAQASGFDGVEVFAAYHACVDQFWTPWSNRRTDDWGGSFEAGCASRRGARPDPGALRRGLHHRAGGQRRPGAEATLRRRSCRGRRLARRAPADGLRHLRHGLVLRLLPDHPDVAVRPATGRAARGGAQGRGAHALVQAESHIRTPEAAEAVLAAGTPTWSASCAARSPTRTWSQGPRRPR
jgi:hypothetical protein